MHELLISSIKGVISDDAYVCNLIALEIF
jgi:hypothetical protein